MGEGYLENYREERNPVPRNTSTGCILRYLIIKPPLRFAIEFFLINAYVPPLINTVG